MQLNSLIFPAPKSFYTEDSIQDIIWIPKNFQDIF